MFHVLHPTRGRQGQYGKEGIQNKNKMVVGEVLNSSSVVVKTANSVGNKNSDRREGKGRKKIKK